MSAVESIRDEMRVRVHRLAEPAYPGESVKSCIRRVSRETGLDFGEVWRLWYGRVRRVPADIADRIRTAAVEHERAFDRRLSEARERQARLYALIHQPDNPDRHSDRAVGPGNRDDERGESADAQRESHCD